MGQTLKDMLNSSFKSHPQCTAVRVLRQEEGELRYKPITYGELQVKRDCLAAGLHALGLRKGRRVGILTDGGEEPLLVFLATDLLGLSAVPLCVKVPAEILIHSINHSGVELLVVDQKGLQQFERVRPLLPRPPRLVLTQGRGEEGLSWEELIEMGAGEEPPAVEVHPEDESKILYTSGSSGLPKGVVQTHANIVANMEEVWDVISQGEALRFFKSPPDYHALGILNIYYPLVKGWTLDLSRSPERVLADIRLSEPEGFLTVPLVLDKVYANVRKEIEKGGLKGQLIQRGVMGKQRLVRGEGNWMDRLFQATLGQKIIGQIRAQLASRVGANLKLLVVGSAKADPEALDFFHEVLDITSYEGYGVTECAPLIAANHRGGRKSGTVGRPLLEVKIVGSDGGEMGHGNPATGEYRGSGGKAGELWASGANVMRGYLGDPDETARVLVEDEQGKVWYRTGDLFSMDDEGFLTFKGRLGRQFKLSNGEFVNPELLERIFSRVQLVEHVLIYGDQSRTFPLPLVTVNLEEAKKLEIKGLPLEDENGLRCHPILAEHIREAFLEEASAAGLPAHDRPQKILLLPESLSEEEGTLTKGLKKIVPGTIVERYREEIEAAYGG